MKAAISILFISGTLLACGTGKPNPLTPEAPIVFGEAVALKTEDKEKIRQELQVRIERDQAVRKGQVVASKMLKVDRDNTLWIKGLVKDYGWVDVKRFGMEAANSAFLIVQHSGDLQLMEAALPWIKEDMLAKRMDAQPYALLYDRLQLKRGKKQRYGTQIGQDEQGNMVILPLEDHERVEEYRKEIGLFPLAEYLRFYEANMGKKVLMPRND